MSAIIFDFDGTIADSFELVLDLYYELTGHERYSATQIAEFKKMTLRKAIKASHFPPRQIPLMMIKGRTHMGKRLHEVKPFPGIKKTLRDLHAHGHMLMVMSSNSHRNVETFLTTHGLGEFFDGVYGGIGLLSKAGAIRKVIRQNKLKSSECYYVGDEVRDIVAGKHAHVRSIAVTWGYNDQSILETKKPFKIATSPSELFNIF